MTDDKIREVKFLVLKFKEWLAVSNFSESMLRCLPDALKPFLQFLTTSDAEDIAAVTPETIRQYQMHLHAWRKRNGQPLSLETQRQRLKWVRSFFRFLAKEGRVLSDPAKEMEFPRTPHRLPRGIMTVGEIRKVLSQPNPDTPIGLRDRAILETLYSTGIRNSELRNLTLYDVDLANQEARINQGKGRKDRVVPLGEVAARAIAEYAREARHQILSAVFAKGRGEETKVLFVSARGRKLGMQGLQYIVGKYVRLAGLPKTITPHSFRHTCATHMLKGHASIRHIQELLGHRSLGTTQIYTRVEPADLKREHRRCHPREQTFR